MTDLEPITDQGTTRATWPVRIRVVVAPSVNLGEQAVTTFVVDRATDALVVVHARALPDPAPDCTDAHDAVDATTAAQHLGGGLLRTVSVVVCSRCRWAGTTDGEVLEGDPVVYAPPAPADLDAIATALGHRGHEEESDRLHATAATFADDLAAGLVEVTPPDPAVPAVLAPPVLALADAEVVQGDPDLPDTVPPASAAVEGSVPPVIGHTVAEFAADLAAGLRDPEDVRRDLRGDA